MFVLDFKITNTVRSPSWKCDHTFIIMVKGRSLPDRAYDISYALFLAFSYYIRLFHFNLENAFHHSTDVQENKCVTVFRTDNSARS